MKVSDQIYLVGSEQFALSHPLDCNCYLIDGGNALGLIDTSLGLGVDDILKNVADDGFDPGKISHVIMTHAHVGHWGGGSSVRSRTGAEVWAPPRHQNYMINPDEEPGIRLNKKFNRSPPGTSTTVSWSGTQWDRSSSGSHTNQRIRGAMTTSPSGRRRSSLTPKTHASPPGGVHMAGITHVRHTR